MATVTYVRTIKVVAEILEEDPELLQAIVCNDDNLSYGSIISVYTGDDESVTALTDDGMDELEQMLKDARRSPQEWNDFLDSFVDDELLIARIKSKISAVAIGRLQSKLLGENISSRKLGVIFESIRDLRDNVAHANTIAETEREEMIVSQTVRDIATCRGLIKNAAPRLANRK